MTYDVCSLQSVCFKLALMPEFMTTEFAWVGFFAGFCVKCRDFV